MSLATEASSPAMTSGLSQRGFVVSSESERLKSATYSRAACG